ncbi:MAG: HAD family phosphatase [Rhodobacteraceae bacterium]|nr:HAD family phosphatase [Paracoccaceae bacterium]
MKQAIFCDIDGCLGPGKHKAFDLEGLAQVRALVKQLAGQGTSFHLCTGRPQAFAEAMAQVVDVQTPFICENGAMIFTPETDLATAMISVAALETVRELHAALSAEGFIMEVGNEYSLCASWPGISEAPQTEIVARREGLEARYTRFGLNWTNSHTSIDVTPYGVSKQSAVAVMLQDMGLQPESAIGIGDSHNDLKMLGYVGRPLCPANANAEVKAVCKTIASRPQVAGVIELLQGLLTA